MEGRPCVRAWVSPERLPGKDCLRSLWLPPPLPLAAPLLTGGVGWGGGQHSKGKDLRHRDEEGGGREKETLLRWVWNIRSPEGEEKGSRRGTENTQ